ncbi:MAG: hypothetical protein BroJett038_11660 [Chloroflexota bacterium]|nr:MAG: hypothetical protein BroJett038_11660 [Chloroflexota bacterium]
MSFPRITLREIPVKGGKYSGLRPLCLHMHHWQEAGLEAEQKKLLKSTILIQQPKGNKLDHVNYGDTPIKRKDQPLPE